jgi:ankyrin repeat protein
LILGGDIRADVSATFELAAKNGDSNVVRVIPSLVPEARSPFLTSHALVFVITNGHLEVAQRLLRMTEDLDVPIPINLPVPDPMWGFGDATPLQHAVKQGSLAMVNLVLSVPGTDLDYTMDKRSPLYLAAEAAHGHSGGSSLETISGI